MESKQDSKTKRSNWHDYREPCIYLVTVTTVDREPLLGQVEGDAIKARIKLSAIGKCVWDEIERLPKAYPQIMVMQHQIMPDHVHLVIRVTERLPEGIPLGNIVAEWKLACGKATASLRDLKATTHNNPTDCKPSSDSNLDGLSCEAAFRSPNPNPAYQPLFAKGFNDSILTGKGQLNHMMAYVRDNPRRLLIKRQNNSLFTIHRNIIVAGLRFDAIGNLALL
jgi:hypothetical protein